jgi:hypothetical protein
VNRTASVGLSSVNVGIPMGYEVPFYEVSLEGYGDLCAELV